LRETSEIGQDNRIACSCSARVDGEAVQAVSSSIAADRESLKQPQLFRRVAKLLGAPESFLPRRPLRLIAGQRSRRYICAAASLQSFRYSITPSFHSTVRNAAAS